jgi:hypothetical protein
MWCSIPQERRADEILVIISSEPVFFIIPLHICWFIIIVEEI